MKESSELNISIYPASSGHSKAIVLTSGSRPEGKFEEEYDIGHLRPGLYVLQIQAGSLVVAERVFIK